MEQVDQGLRGLARECILGLVRHGLEEMLGGSALLCEIACGAGLAFGELRGLGGHIWRWLSIGSLILFYLIGVHDRDTPSRRIRH